MLSNAVKTEDNELRDRLRQLAREVMSEVSELEASRREEQIRVFVSDLSRLAEEQEQRETRRRKQAEGILAAKERGVKFGRERIALPENFPDYARLWQAGGISSRNAARELGISYKTFQRRAKEYCSV